MRAADEDLVSFEAECQGVRLRFRFRAGLTKQAVEFFVAYLDQMIGAGAGPQPGQPFAAGCILLSCQLEDDGSFRLRGPDFASPEIALIDDLSWTIILLYEHRFVPESFSCAADIPLMTAHVLVPEVFGPGTLFMNRGAAQSDLSNDTGWFLGVLEAPKRGKLRQCSVYELIVERPECSRFLSLPAGYQVVFAADTTTVHLNKHPLRPAQNSHFYLNPRSRFSVA